MLAPSCSTLGGGGSSAAEEAAEGFLDAWAVGDVEAMGALAEGGDPAALDREFRAALHVASAEVSELEVDVEGSEGTATFQAEVGLQGLGIWTYDGRLRLTQADGDWKVRYESPSLHAEVGEGDRLQRTRTQGLRAPIVAAGGQPLAIGGPGEQGRLVELASALLGGLRELGAEELTGRDLTYQAGDLVGADGVEAGFEGRLVGDPIGSIQVVDAAGGPGEVLVEFGGERPPPVELTLDYAIQRAAETAVATQSLPTALVAIDSRTGAIRAVANNPPGYDRALLGQYPPGSTMKIVTAAAALANGRTADEIVACPYETQVGDSAVFSNAFGEEFGDIPLHEAFAHSCNTTFVDLGYELGPARLQEAAENFGFNTPFGIGVPVSPSSFPLPESDTETAAASLGQGRVAVTPLQMASVAAAAYDGTWRVPFLAGDPPPEGQRPLPDAAAAALPDLMREVVRTGTGQAAAILGRDVGGKTGTAEFGDEDPPETHAWFAGFIGDLAYAAVVEGGGVGGQVAAPLIHEFLVNLPAPPVGPGALPEG